MEFGLPSEYIDFVRSGRQLEYDFAKCEAGKIKLRPLDHLRLREIFAEAGQTFADFDEVHGGELGEYAIPAVPLASCEKSWLDSDSLLLWYPTLLEFGQWDSNHSIAYRFAGTTWLQIAQRPLPYLNAKWVPKRRGMGKIIKKLRPWSEPIEGARFVDRDYVEKHRWPKEDAGSDAG